MKILLVTYCDRIYKNILRDFEETKVLYCNKYQLDFKCVTIDNLIPYKKGWLKVDILKECLNQYDYVFITDYDTVIVDQTFDIYDLIRRSNGCDIICNELPNGFKLLGSSIFKNSENNRIIIDKLLNSVRDNNFLAEEQVFNQISSDLTFYIEPRINIVHKLHNNNTPFILHFADERNPFNIKYIYGKAYRNKGHE